MAGDLAMRYYETTYTDARSIAHEAVEIPHEEVRAILDSPHRGIPTDDDALREALIRAGAPEWVRDADEGYIDESGWGLIGWNDPGWHLRHAPLPIVAEETIRGAEEDLPDPVMHALIRDLRGRAHAIPLLARRPRADLDWALSSLAHVPIVRAGAPRVKSGRSEWGADHGLSI